jgi:hypothetical protein
LCHSHFYSLPMMHEALQHMLTMLMPNHVLHHTKRYLCHKCHKPANMKVCMFYNHLSNMVLNELHCLPPFGNNQSLGTDEVVNILLFATPNSWQNNGGSDGNTFYCKVHGHNPNHTTKQCHKAKKVKAKGKPIEPQKAITTRNPQANAMVECAHQTILNMICTHNL